MDIIEGPSIEAGEAPLFQVTLPNGAVLTRPSDFASDCAMAAVQPEYVFSEAGQLLRP
jgi:hypothetical protein